VAGIKQPNDHAEPTKVERMFYYVWSLVYQ